MSVHRKKDGRWAVVFYLEGKQQWRYFGRGQEGELAARQFDIDRRKGKRTALILDEKTFGDVAQAYLDTQPLSQGHRRNVRYALNAHVMDLFGQTPVSRLSMKDLVDLDAKLSGRALATKNRYKIYCRIVLEWGVRYDLIESNPFKKFRPNIKAEGKAPAPPTPEEMKAIRQASKPHLRWAIFCMAHLGLRPGPTELFQVRMSDVDFAKQGVWVSRSKTHDAPILQPVRPEFLEEVRARTSQTWLIEYRGRQVLNLKKSWHGALRRAGIQRRLRLYDLRHLYATTLIRAGADLKAVSELLGHASPQTTLRVYHHVMDAERRAALDKLPETSY